MGIKRTLSAALLAGSIACGGGLAVAQESTPDASPVAIAERQVPLMTAGNEPFGDALFVQGEDGTVTITITSDDSGLEPGQYGVHIHEAGVCDANEGEEPFGSAGGHFNPDSSVHGAPDSAESHAGDLGNLTVEDDGSIDFTITTDRIALQGGVDHSLSSENGSSIIVHDGEDDLQTDPSGESGSRYACGTIYQWAASATPETDLSSTPIATPEN